MELVFENLLDGLMQASRWRPVEKAVSNRADRKELEQMALQVIGDWWNWTRNGTRQHGEGTGPQRSE